MKIVILFTLDPEPVKKTIRCHSCIVDEARVVPYPSRAANAHIKLQNLSHIKLYNPQKFYSKRKIMSSSALEKEILLFILKLKRSLSTHDRGVLFGFLLTLVPFFPVTIAGLLIGALNYSVLKSGKLNISEKGMIKKSFIIGSANLTINLILIYVLMNFITELDFSNVINYFNVNFSRIFFLPRNILHSMTEAAS